MKFNLTITARGSDSEAALSNLTGDYDFLRDEIIVSLVRHVIIDVYKPDVRWKVNLSLSLPPGHPCKHLSSRSS